MGGGGQTRGRLCSEDPEPRGRGEVLSSISLGPFRTSPASSARDTHERMRPRTRCCPRNTISPLSYKCLLSPGATEKKGNGRTGDGLNNSRLVGVCQQAPDALQKYSRRDVRGPGNMQHHVQIYHLPPPGLNSCRCMSPFFFLWESKYRRPRQ